MARTIEGAGLHSWACLQLLHHLSTPLNRAEPGSCPAPRPRILGQATKAGTGTKGGLIWAQGIQEALSEDRDGGQSVTGSTLGPAGLPPCHRALHVVSKEAIWVVLFFLKLTCNRTDSKMSLAQKLTGRQRAHRFHSYWQDATGQCFELQSTSGSACRMKFPRLWESSAMKWQLLISVSVATAFYFQWQGLISPGIQKSFPAEHSCTQES